MSTTELVTDPESRPVDILRRDLTAILGDGASYSLMVGLGETYLVAFALAIQAGEIAAGLIASLPMVIGGILQLTTPRWVEKIGCHRHWVVGCAVIQAISLALLPLAVLLDGYGVWLIFIAATMYWTGGLGTNSAWSTWIEEIVPPFLRTHFFARRVRISQACSLIGFVLGGLCLQLGSSKGQALLAFSCVFLFASAARFISAACLASQTEPSAGRFTSTQVGISGMLKKLRGHTGVRLLCYLFAVQTAVQISGPYFSPFMLRQLEMGYLEFMFLIAFGYVGKVISLPAWGRFAHVYGPHKLLWIGGLSIIPVSGAWMGLWWIPDRFLFVAVVQLVGGVAWAAYELAFFLLFFEAIPRRERTSLLTLYNFGNAICLGIGSMIGATWLSVMGENANAYLALFGISSFFRGVALILLCRVSSQGGSPGTIRPDAVETVVPQSGTLDWNLAATDETILVSKC